MRACLSCVGPGCNFYTLTNQVLSSAMLHVTLNRTELGKTTWEDYTDSSIEKCATSQWQVHPVAMTTDERFVAANALLQQVDANIVKTAMLRREMPLKCAKLLARQCRLQMQSLELKQKSVKSVEPLFVVNNVVSSETVDDDSLNAVRDGFTQLRHEMHELSVTEHHLKKARQIQEANDRIFANNQTNNNSIG